MDNGNDGLDWYFDLNNDGGFAEVTKTYGLSSHTPIVGDWNGDGRADMATVVQEGSYLYWYFDLDDGDDVWAEKKFVSEGA